MSCMHRHMLTHTRTHTHTHTHTHAHTHTYTHTCIFKCIFAVESPSSDDDQGNMFSTFRMRNGEEYTVYNKDGKRYYVDWETQVNIIHTFTLSLIL